MTCKIQKRSCLGRRTFSLDLPRTSRDGIKFFLCHLFYYYFIFLHPKYIKILHNYFPFHCIIIFLRIISSFFFLLYYYIIIFLLIAFILPSNGYFPLIQCTHVTSVNTLDQNLNFSTKGHDTEVISRRLILCKRSARQNPVIERSGKFGRPSEPSLSLKG